MSAKTGSVTGFSRGTNQDGVTEVLKLQLVVTEPTDVRKVQHDTLGGIDSNPPLLSRATVVELDGYSAVVAVDDNVPKTALPGGAELYSSLAGVKLGRVKLSPDGKLAIGNSFGELFDLFDQNLAALQTATTTTSLGPQPLDPATQATLTALRVIVALMKGSL